MAVKSDFSFLSADNVHKCHAEVWEPEDKKPVAVLQIVHGMIEYIRRYDDFATFLTEHGFVVVGEDHLGHGYTASEQDLGYFTEDRPWDVLIENVETVRKIMTSRYPDLKYCMLGHSMGSFIFRKYIALHGEKIDAAIVMGTAMMPRIVTSTGVALTYIQRVFFGDRHVSPMIARMAFGSYNKRIPDAASPNAWLSANADNVAAYDKDPLCTFPFTINAYRTLFKILGYVCKKSTIARTPRNLPILVIAGMDDPVGNYGAGPSTLYKEYQKIGVQDATLKLYEGLRHEILNESNRKDVYNDILEWLLGRINVNK